MDSPKCDGWMEIGHGRGETLTRRQPSPAANAAALSLCGGRGVGGVGRKGCLRWKWAIPHGLRGVVSLVDEPMAVVLSEDDVHAVLVGAVDQHANSAVR
jgi:hypothetical protein